MIFGCSTDISRIGYRHAEPDDPRYFIKRSPMMPHHSKDVDRREVRSLAARLHNEYLSDSPNEFWPSAFDGEPPAQESKLPVRTAFKEPSARVDQTNPGMLSTMSRMSSAFPKCTEQWPTDAIGRL